MKNVNRQDGGKVGRVFARKQQELFGAPDPALNKGTGWQRQRNQTVTYAHEVTQCDRVILMRLDATVQECQEWLTEMGMRVQSVMPVAELRGEGLNPRVRDAFVFKKRRHAAAFKLAWG